ncbi:chaperone protein DnaJ isoform X1 [Macadamia integrifolia]|uniref:chaperone protein DnaJ isoform X1 n=1 Tax=Macadamia integrifolia TaxID=60698 RepID=UPI001C52A5D2|nr:chaperone protein DnaJ isoform X1 [Macadamia integrifolia]
MMRNHGSGGLGGRGMQKLRFLTANPKSSRCVRFPTRSLRFSDEFAVLGLTPFASKADVKQAYKRLALKYHPDVMKGENLPEKQDIFREIKSSYESLMDKFEEEEQQVQMDYYDEYDEWDEWMGFEGGMPMVYNSS